LQTIARAGLIRFPADGLFQGAATPLYLFNRLISGLI
jgi:hypothetical protein